jgi:hypothetical protein
VRDQLRLDARRFASLHAGGRLEHPLHPHCVRREKGQCRSPAGDDQAAVLDEGTQGIHAPSFSSRDRGGVRHGQRGADNATCGCIPPQRSCTPATRSSALRLRGLARTCDRPGGLPAVPVATSQLGCRSRNAFMSARNCAESATRAAFPTGHAARASDARPTQH